MARYILIQVEDNEIAGDFVYALQHYPEGIFFYKKNLTGDDAYTVTPFKGATVRALFGKPTQFCACPPSDKSVRGANMGWWICAACAKPRQGVCQHPRNLLEPKDRLVKDRDLYLGIWEPSKGVYGK